MMGFNWRCAIGLHPWPMWSMPYRKSVTLVGIGRPFDHPVEVTETYQDRTCPACGKYDKREIVS